MILYKVNDGMSPFFQIATQDEVLEVAREIEAQQREVMFRKNRAEQWENNKGFIKQVATNCTDWLIIWCGRGCESWERFTGTLDEATAEVNRDYQYEDNGRRGAIIVPYIEMYSVIVGPVEKRWNE